MACLFCLLCCDCTGGITALNRCLILSQLHPLPVCTLGYAVADWLNNPLSQGVEHIDKMVLWVRFFSYTSSCFEENSPLRSLRSRLCHSPGRRDCRFSLCFFRDIAILTRSNSLPWKKKLSVDIQIERAVHRWTTSRPD